MFVSAGYSAQLHRPQSAIADTGAYDYSTASTTRGTMAEWWWLRDSSCCRSPFSTEESLWWI